MARDDELSSLVARRLGTEALATSPVGWGFSAVTLRVRLGSGRHQIAQLRARPEALSIVRATRSLRACGVPAPCVVHVLRATDESAWILFEEVAGEVAAARLGSAAEVGMAATLGSTLAVVQACSASAFTPDPAWVDGRALVASVQRWSQDAEAPVRAAVVASGERVASRSWIADVAVARAAQLASGSPFVGRAHLYELLSTALAWVAAALRESPHN